MLSLDRQEACRRRYAASRTGYRTAGQVFEALLMHHLPEARRALDAGCGRAGILQDHHRESRFLVGADGDLASLMDNPRLHGRVMANLEELPFADASFDLVGAAWVMEHLEEPQVVFQELGRALRPGGHLLILTPNKWSPVSLLNRAVPGRVQSALVERIYGRKEGDTFPVRYRANTRARLAALARAAGLEEVEFHHVGDPSYLALNELSYRAAVLIERLTDPGPLRRFKVHLVGDYRKPDGGIMGQTGSG